jgi:hypothetical protein
MPDHLASGRYNFFIKYKNGLYHAPRYLLAYTLNPYSLLYLYVQRRACGQYERNNLA